MPAKLLDRDLHNRIRRIEHADEHLIGRQRVDTYRRIGRAFGVLHPIDEEILRLENVSARRRRRTGPAS